MKGEIGALSAFSDIHLANTPMKINLIIAAFIMCACGLTAAAQNPLPAPSNKPNPDIQKMIREVSAKNIQATILKLVSFGTRNTLSEQDNPNRGIGAARDWLYGQFQQAAAASAGRMTVEKQTFEQPKGPRVPQ